MTDLTAHRGEIIHFLDNSVTVTDNFQHFSDGILVVGDGHVLDCGDAAQLLKKLPDNIELVEHRDALLTPGFVDTHIHFPQCDIIASYGTQLLDWLERYTFPAEEKLSDKANSDDLAEFFLDELLRNGTTTALVFATSHPQSVESFFSTAQARKLRMICGKVMMDRNAPAYLCDTAESSAADTQQLIDRWHGVDRLSYAITPRFAPTSSPQQLQLAGELLAANTGVYLQTHLAENPSECNWVKSLFPHCKNYLDVYDYYKLLGDHSVFAHGIHLCDEEWGRLAETDSSLAFCPCSNLFIGSGLFKLSLAEKHKVNVGLGTDVGGGDTFSLLRTLNEAYKTQQLLHNNIDAIKMLYMITLGGARTLNLQHCIGNFLPEKEADFVVLDYTATPLIKRRIQACTTIEERLFALLMLGDDRAVRATYILGNCVHSR